MMPIVTDYSYRNGIMTFLRKNFVGALSALALPVGSAALDLGCGGGRDAICLAKNGFTVIGIDLAPAAIDVAKQRAQ